MKTFFLAALSAALFSLAASAQVPQPAPTPVDEDVVKITTALIQVDVTVTDSKGNIISDLKPEEFEIYENGKKQDITNFTFVSNARTRVETPARANTSPAVPVPPAAIRADQVRRTIALVVDDLTLSFESAHFTRRALKKFVDEQMQEGDLVAIIRTGAGIGALQQFTTDRRQLYAAIEKVRWNPSGSGGIGAFTPLEAIEPAADEGEAEPGTRTAEGREREMNDFRESLFATGTLGAVNYIVRGMQDLPGRKSVLLLSDGFKLFTTDASGFRESGRVLESLRRLVDMANRASVVIYTMDARGLQYTGLTAADNTGGRSAEQLGQAVSNRRDQLLDTQDGLRYLARETGGISIVNNNDLSGGIRRILDDQSYYLIGYQPDDETFDPKVRRFNKLEIKVTRPNTKIRYRSGFFGISDEKIKPSTTATAAQRLLNALTSPFAVNDVAVRLNALFGSDEKTGAYIQSLVHVRAQDMKFSDEPDGQKKAEFEVLAVGFGDNGVPVEQLHKNYTLRLTKDAFERIQKLGFVYQFIFPVKKPGAYQLRVALRDQATGSIGSANQFIEVPNIKKNRLVLSSMILENLSFEDWKKRDAALRAGQPSPVQGNPPSDTSLRQFRRGSVLNYGFIIFNPKLAPAPDLTYRMRLYRDGKVIFEGQPNKIPASQQAAANRVPVAGTLSLGTAMAPGDYILQIEVTDNLAKGKRKQAWQFIQFEVTD